MAPPMTPARKACPPRSMSGAMLLRHGQRHEGRQSHHQQHQRLVGHEIEEGEDDQREPERQRRTAAPRSSLTWWRHSQARQPLAAIWMTPWNTMATGTGSSTSREADQQHAARHAENAGDERGHDGHDGQAPPGRAAVNIEARRSARGRSCRGSDKVDACPIPIFSSCRPCRPPPSSAPGSFRPSTMSTPS